MGAYKGMGGCIQRNGWVHTKEWVGAYKGMGGCIQRNGWVHTKEWVAARTDGQNDRQTDYLCLGI